MIPKTLRIQARFVIMSYKMIWQYPFMILGGFIESTATLLAFVIFWQIILVDQMSFGVWPLEEILIFSALGYFCWGIGSFLFVGVWMLPYKIIQGDIERWLCRPLRHPLLGVLFEEVWVGGSAFLVVSTIMLWTVSTVYKIHYELLNVIIAFICLILGITTLYLMYGAITAFLGFTIGRAEFIHEALESIEESFARVPVTSLPHGVRGILTFGFPIAFMSAFPAEILFNRHVLSASLGLIIFILIPLLIFWSLTFLQVWRFGTKRYESVSN